MDKHCDHECVCFTYLGMLESTEDEPCISNLCKNNTRSRQMPDFEIPTDKGDPIAIAYYRGKVNGRIEGSCSERKNMLKKLKKCVYIIWRSPQSYGKRKVVDWSDIKSLFKKRKMLGE